MKDMKKDNHLPLYLLQEDGMLIYVIDNQIFGCESLSGFGYYGTSKSLNMLKKFSQITKDIFKIPEAINDFLLQYEPVEVEDVFDFIIGAKGYYGWRYIDFDISLTAELNISFHSFVYEGRNLPHKFVISPKDAFIILTNHMVNCRSHFLKYDFREDKMDYGRLPERYDTQNPIAISLHNRLTDSIKFAKLCSEYFLHEIQSKKISPFELHRLNGAHIIELLKSVPIVQSYILKIIEELLIEVPEFQYNRNVMNYSLLNIIDNFWIFADYPNFSEINQKIGYILKRLNKTIRIPLPDVKDL